MLSITSFFLFFFNDTATTEIYTLSLHDALPISVRIGGFALLLAMTASVVYQRVQARRAVRLPGVVVPADFPGAIRALEQVTRSEEHTSELQSQSNLVCRLLLEKKNKELRIRSLA